MQMHQIPCERQAYAEAVARTIRRSVNLHEHLPNSRNQVNRDAHAVIPDDDNCLAILDLQADVNTTARIGVLDCIQQYIFKYLLQAHPVCLHPDGFPRDRDIQSMTRLFNERPARLQHAGYFFDKVDLFRSQLYFPSRYPRDIEKIVDQMRHVLELSFNDLLELAGLG